MDDELRRIVESRLEGSSLSDEAGLMVLGALEGREALAELLEGQSHEPTNGNGRTHESPARAPSATYLASIAVEGFRGIGPRAVLEIQPGPGLTLVVGRNGSGKSSFAEGLEVLLTGENRRWSERSSIWKEGWRNLHHEDPVAIEARFHVEGHAGPTVITRTWDRAAEIDDGETTAQHYGAPRTDFDSLGWAAPLAAYRPFLSYNELGSMFNEGPARLYDALSAILGLEALVEAQDALRQARLSRSRATKDLKQRRDRNLLSVLEESDDPRALSAEEALLRNPMDLDALEALVTEPGSGAASAPKLQILSRLMLVEAPDPAELSEVAGTLREAAHAVERVSGTDSALARDMLDLLASAIGLHDEHRMATCPVCESGALDDGWRDRASERMARLEQTAQEAEAAHALANEAIERMGRTLTRPPAVLSEADQVGLDSEGVRTAWKELVEQAPKALAPMADHIERLAPRVAERVHALLADATREHARLQDVWRPVALELASFAQDARSVLIGERQVKTLKEAEDWLKGALGDIRNDRFAPISQQSTAIWKRFGSPTNVELAHIELAGSQTKRRVVLDVRIDGKDGAALAVMSQGELHALALSLFLPRATLPESPFGFLIIDDPVQAMDPARVDGLARVLDDVAQTRQVIVFTHDDRLPESIRRLEIEARVIEVARRDNSVVELRPALDPVSRYLDDARALSATEDLPPPVATRVVPGFCRLALEAACAEVVRRRRILRGEPHAAVEDALRESRKLSQRMALALFDDSSKSGDVLQRLNRIDGNAADAYKDCNRGAHEPCPSARLPQLIRSTDLLTRKLRTVQ